ncbi:MAG: YigZ family protein [Saprospiraceae bacterium]
MIKDTYQIPDKATEGEYKEKGSKFLAYLFPVISTSEVTKKLEDIRTLHPKARHHCYAYRLGIDGAQYRSNDDGEPSGTAGKPILGQLLSHRISDTLIIVVRYFGGTKLGASGLITAYKTAAHESLLKVNKVDFILCHTYKLNFSYSEMGHVMNVIKQIGLDIRQKSFDNQPEVIVEIPISNSNSTIIRLKAMLLNVSLDQIVEKTIVPFCAITKL